MLNRLPAIASAAILALSLSAPAFAQNTSWGNASNGYGRQAPGMGGPTAIALPSRSSVRQETGEE
jgi:hypothetical protein